MNDNKRHILKTISWRILATLITILVSLIISGDINIALNIGLFEVIIKMIVYYGHERFWFNKIRFKKKKQTNIHPKEIGIPKNKRFELLNQNPITIWITGLSGSGKSTIAAELNKLLHEHKFKSFILDGDNIRYGLNSDLSFNKRDREENLRRVAETAKLFNDSGIIIITAFISPYKKTRELSKNIIGEENFIEVYANSSLDTCKTRDVKGLYKLAAKGKIKNFTGVNDPYEIPEKDFIEINTNIEGTKNIKKQAKKIFDLIETKIKMN